MATCGIRRKIWDPKIQNGFCFCDRVKSLYLRARTVEVVRNKSTKITILQRPVVLAFTHTHSDRQKNIFSQKFWSKKLCPSDEQNGRALGLCFGIRVSMRACEHVCVCVCGDIFSNFQTKKTLRKCLLLLTW